MYALGRWDELEIYAYEGRLEIDPNTCVRGIRPTEVGKKNGMFIGETHEGHRRDRVHGVNGGQPATAVNRGGAAAYMRGLAGATLLAPSFFFDQTVTVFRDQETMLVEPFFHP